VNDGIAKQFPRILFGRVVRDAGHKSCTPIRPDFRRQHQSVDAQFHPGQHGESSGRLWPGLRSNGRLWPALGGGLTGERSGVESRLVDPPAVHHTQQSFATSAFSGNSDGNDHTHTHANDSDDSGAGRNTCVQTREQYRRIRTGRGALGRDRSRRGSRLSCGQWRLPVRPIVLAAESGPEQEVTPGNVPLRPPYVVVTVVRSGHPDVLSRLRGVSLRRTPGHE